MRKILTILVLSAPFLAFGQSQPPIVQGSKLYEFKNGLRIDTALFLPRKDTGTSDATMRAPGMLVYRTTDSLLYYRKGDSMVALTTGSLGDFYTKLQSDLRYIRNQNAVPQNGVFWIDGAGRVGGNIFRVDNFTDTSLHINLESSSVDGVIKSYSGSAFRPLSFNGSKYTFFRPTTGYWFNVDNDQFAIDSSVLRTTIGFTVASNPSPIPGRLLYINGRASGQDAVSDSEFVTKRQITTGGLGPYWKLAGNTLASTDTLGANNNQSIKLKGNGTYTGEIRNNYWFVNPTNSAGSLMFLKNQDTTSSGSSGLLSIYKPRYEISSKNSAIAGVSLFPFNNWTTMSLNGPTWFYGFDPNEKTGYLTFGGRDETGKVYPYFTVNKNFLVGVGWTGTYASIDPTAMLHIAPGLDTVSAFKLSTGAYLNTPQAGSFEYRNTGSDSTLWFTLRSARRKFLFNGDAINNQTLAVQSASSRISGSYNIGDTLNHGLGDAKFYTGEVITDHAHYGFLDGSWIRYSGIGTQARAAFNDNSHYEGTAGADHAHSFQAFPHYGASGVLARMSGFWMSPDVTDGTVTELSEFKAHNPLGTGAITNLYGLYIENLDRGTTNYAIYSPGTVRSFHGGGLAIGANSTLNTVHITSATTTGLGVQNTSTPSASSGAFLRLYNSGTPSGADQRIAGQIFGTNPTGTTIRAAAQIDVMSEATWTDGSSQPSYLRFWTTPSGSPNILERLRITAAGNVAIGTTSGDSKLRVAGPVATAFTSVSANTTLDNTHSTVRVTTAAVTITLPTASTCTGRVYCIINYNTGGTINTSAYLSPAAVSTTTIANQTTVWVQSDGTNWYQIK